jgi:PLP dependent protein
MISNNILRIQGRISSICSKANRNRQDITLIAVSKGRPVGEIEEVLSRGIRDIAENRVQEATIKFQGLEASGYELRTHLVGHLQTNKAKEAVKIFNLIHSVDSLRLAKELDKQAAGIDKVQDILVEVKTSYEESKYGFSPQEVVEVLKQMAFLKNIRILGMMTIAPVADNPEAARPYFRQLRQLQDKINELGIIGYELKILSMGMSDDFEVAIEEGSTMLRLGRALFNA